MWYWLRLVIGKLLPPSGNLRKWGFAAALVVLITGASQSRQHGKSELLDVGIKSLLDVVWITAAHVCVNAAQLDIVLLRDFKENMLTEVNAASENMLEVTTASE
ncbi:hypothetical protein Tco_0942956, partial [Tanacetum coccineum]